MDSITQNPSTQTDDADEDPLLKASMATLNLYKIRDTFYPKNPDDKISKLQQDSQYCLNLLDSIPPEFRKSAIQRATYEHLKGKVLDVFPDYRKEAEDHLSKAVKLNPSLTDAWLSLGNCFWKKGELVSAKNCFHRALSKGPDKNVLCQLSMLERKMAQDSDNKAELVDESIRHAKEAIALDVADGNSWYNLGNACLTSFFASGAWDHSKLCQSLKAYQNAEKDEMMKGNPDLYFNCATVNKYLENYDKALNGFEAACKIDPALNASGEIQKMVGLLDKLESLLKGHIKAKRLASLVSSLVPVEANLSYKKATIDLLFEGLNKSTAVTGKVLFYVKHDNVAPLYYVACDSNQMCFVLSVYGIQDNVIREGDQITLLEPWFKNVNFSWKGKHYSFKSIRADFKEQVMVNGKALSANQAISTSFYAQHKPT
ncbi:LOW QUALITY PROTEIN: tetratricopeptide repeat protein 5-like [Chenopodium quinoa]|uniref:LOW QUALITY PROTEIN: tetratricopeptide repeat protein 5-like n=1 Tax=Chenopodium quinoa TaxID=63459 RepID=UPI000B77783A|nr:LOW QUALITY PROTEIN: tetratricopeptide repeat protein 5-like [Chenopodium quinoa]